MQIIAGMGRCVQRPVVVLGGCEFAGYARFRGPDGLVRSIDGLMWSIAGAGAKSLNHLLEQNLT